MSDKAYFSGVFRGTLIYVASLVALELLLLWVRDIGAVSCAVTALAALIAGVYFFSTDASIPGRMLSRGRRMRVRTLIGLFALIVTLQAFSSAMLLLAETLLNRLGFSLFYSPALTTDYTSTWTMVLYSALVGPLAEEIVFRGLIMRGFERGGRVFAIVSQALLFSLMHADPAQLVFTFLVGLLLGYTAFEYSLAWAFVLHVFNNGVLGILLSFLAAGAGAVLMLAGVCIGIIVLIRHFRDMLSYMREHRAVKGAYSSYINAWFLIFLVFELFSLALTLVRV